MTSNHPNLRIVASNETRYTVACKWYDRDTHQTSTVLVEVSKEDKEYIQEHNVDIRIDETGNNILILITDKRLDSGLSSIPIFTNGRSEAETVARGVELLKQRIEEQEQ